MSAPPLRTSRDAESNDAQPASPGVGGSESGSPRPAAGSVREGGGACVRELGGGARIVTASVGDHPLVLQLLMQAHQAPLAEDFQSRLDEPGYRPSHRLLLQRDKRLLGHVHVANHIAWFEGQRIPVVILKDFTVLPEYHDSDYEADLLAAAESIAAAEGAVLALVRTDRNDWFERRGWIAWRGQGHTRANARTALAHLDPQEAPRRRRRTGVEVRLWRHFELDAIQELYAVAAAALWGPVYRSEACWQWLIGRKAQDQILVAVQQGKHQKPPGHDAAPKAVGYAIVRGSAIIELMSLPHSSPARVQLLAAACRDAIDRGHNSIALYSPASDSLHELLVTAGGAWISDRLTRSPRWMVRLLAPQRWVERCYELWRQRAHLASVARPFEFGIADESGVYRFALTRRSARLERTTSLPADSIACARSVLDQLLIGDLAVARAVAEGRLHVSPAGLQSPLAAVFAPRLFWQSSLELLRL
ncbi:MAG: hypothetical protein DCC67_12840 [Planctomycetota bacterium]|nr:MAG: hypothetical protein DCC67_12840 [Planctomycetota bacterium]